MSIEVNKNFRVFFVIPVKRVMWKFCCSIFSFARFLCLIKKRRGGPGLPGLGVFVLCLKCSESLLCFPTLLAFCVCVSLAVTECCYNKIRPGPFTAASQVSVNMFSDCRHLLKYASCRQALLPSPLLQNERIEK